MTDSYRLFLDTKRIVAPVAGFEVADEDLHPALFDWQRDITRWAIRRGRAALFVTTGGGKTRMQAAWAEQVCRRTGGDVLILAPLAVAPQTVAEAARIDIPVTLCRSQADVRPGINITNYEMLGHFDPAAFVGIVLDESSCLKDTASVYRNRLIECFAATPYRLCCTATPAPNDVQELTNHSAFLGVMKRRDVLATFFTHNSSDGRASGWSLKGHARPAFFRWLASWSMALTRPSDLGYSDDGFVLPPLRIDPVFVPVDWTPPGQLLFTGLKGVGHRASVRRETLDARVAATAELVAREPAEPWLIWAGLNDEARALTAAIPGAVNVEGNDSSEYKTAAAHWFAGMQCLCNNSLFRDKLAAWRAMTETTSASITSATENDGLRSQSSITGHKATNDTSICASGSQITGIKLENIDGQPLTSATLDGGISTPASQSDSRRHASKPRTGNGRIQTSFLPSGSNSSASPLTSTMPSSLDKEEDAQSVAPSQQAHEADACTSITATRQDASGEFFATRATSDSVNSATIPTDSNALPCICGHASGRRILISKVGIFGFGMNFQLCARMAFCGLGDSFEQYFQALRRCWRFGQTRPVHAYVVLSDAEAAVHENVLRKEQEHTAMMRDLITQIAGYEREELAGSHGHDPYEPAVPLALPAWLTTTREAVTA